ncbi:MAG: hypothetical protein P8J34_07185 [Flavobacteriales bacterium]|nr:hypothetical protein [Flavobacteriales bacterium]
MINSDFIIVLAWPEGETTAAGAWYDSFCATNGKYRVGHSALILINSENKELLYFDFGRYHTPTGFGRVRDKETDPDIGIPISAEIEDNRIKNIKEILVHTKNKKANHGEGKLYASVLKNVNFISSYKFAKKIQEKGIIPYGPFVPKGSNCSRFVSATIRKSNPSLIKNLRLQFPFSLSPSPKRNVSISNNNYYVIEKNKFEKIKRNKINGYFRGIEKK